MFYVPIGLFQSLTGPCFKSRMKVTAVPPDVWRWLRPAVELHASIGLCPWFGLCPYLGAIESTVGKITLFCKPGLRAEPEPRAKPELKNDPSGGA